jgi:hypothetical protein
MNIIKYILTIASLLLLTACGGGSDSTGTGITAAATTMKLTVAINGSNASSVKGIQATITVPDGVSIKADAEGKITEGVITGSATAPTGNIDGKYTAIDKKVTLGFTTDGTITEGDLATMTIDFTTATAPAATAFTITSSKLVDADGNAVSGVSLALR